MKPETTTELRRLKSECDDPHGREDACAELQYALLDHAEELLSLAEREQWIKVSERLPESGTLVWTSYLGEVESGWYSAEDLQWYDADDDRMFAPSHWQPIQIPLPPDLESKNQ